MRRAMQVIVVAALCLALAVPASAGPVSASPVSAELVFAGVSPQWIWDKMQQWFREMSGFIQKLQNFSSQAVSGLFEQVRGWLHTGQMGQITAMIEHLGRLAKSLGDPFAWLYQRALADLQVLLGGDPAQRGSPAWHAARNPHGRAVAEASVQQRVAAAQSIGATRRLAQVSRDVSNAVAVATDARQSAQGAYNTAQMLEAQGRAIPSTRAGIQALIAGQAAALRAYGDSMQALANRLNAIAKQGSVSAQQLDEINKNIRELAELERKKVEQEEIDRRMAVEAMNEVAGAGLGGIQLSMIHGVMARPQPGDENPFEILRPNRNRR